MKVKLWNNKVFSILKSMEKLEQAYIRDAISPPEYESECQKLIARYKTLSSTMNDAVPSIKRFHDTYKMDCTAAPNGLLASGVPATVEHHRDGAAMSLAKIKDWILRLSRMGTADELTEQQARQLHFDLESSYNSFMPALSSAGA